MVGPEQRARQTIVGAGALWSNRREIQPPMGSRFRLKAGVDISGLNPQSRVVAQAMKDYGMILADNGSNYFFQSEDDPRWSDGINDLKQILESR